MWEKIKVPLSNVWLCLIFFITHLLFRQKGCNLQFISINLLITFRINRLVHKISENSSSKSPRVQSDVFKLLLLSSEPCRTQRLFIHCHKWFKKSIKSSDLRSWNRQRFDIFAWKNSSSWQFIVFKWTNKSFDLLLRHGVKNWHWISVGDQRGTGCDRGRRSSQQDGEPMIYDFDFVEKTAGNRLNSPSNIMQTVL